jgi:hypothetical protein
VEVEEYDEGVLRVAGLEEGCGDLPKGLKEGQSGSIEGTAATYWPYCSSRFEPFPAQAHKLM